MDGNGGFVVRIENLVLEINVKDALNVPCKMYLLNNLYLLIKASKKYFVKHVLYDSV